MASVLDTTTAPTRSARFDAGSPDSAGFDYDWLVIGSGFGGSVSALRLAEKGYTVGVLEAGRRFRDEDFAKSTWDAKNFNWLPQLGLRGILRLTPFKDVFIASGAGSLVYANTLYRAAPAFYRNPQWADLQDWEQALRPHYDTAEYMLGVQRVPRSSKGQELLKEVGRHFGVEHTFTRTACGVYFGKPGETVRDPYFGGEGPERTGCIFCGECMQGCRTGAKNNLTKNYLWFAERRGARIHPEREVVDVRPIGAEDGDHRPVRIRDEPGAGARAAVGRARGGTLMHSLSLVATGPNDNDLVESQSEFIDCFERQRGAFLAHPYPSHEERVADLRAMHRLLVENRDALVEAVHRDYGNRSRFETLFTECLLNQEGILDAIKHLRRWMKPQKRRLDITQYPLASAKVIPQPVGVVGVVAPWNFPISMAFAPLTGIIAAGNRAMVKMSENSNHVARLLMEVSPRYLPVDKIRFFEDGGGRGPAFTTLPFDHIFFTESPQTGRAVMANAARNLTPVTLELGGKSPTVVAPDYPIRTAVERIMWVKMLNAGQICTNVDYLFLPEDKVDDFVRIAREVVQQRYPDINGNDYTSIIDERSYRRLETTLEDARRKGARLVNLVEGQVRERALRKFAPHIVLEPTDDMEILQREIFGPLLPIKTYRTKEEVRDYVRARPHPLAFYIYTNDRHLQDWYVTHLMSGVVSINDGLIHAGLHALPFGGIGNSGMGHYHGYEGFTTFSKMRPVFMQGPIRPLNMLLPPYEKGAFKLLNLMLRLKS